MNNTDNTHLLIERMCAKVNDGRTITADDVAEMLDTIKVQRAEIAAAYEAAAQESGLWATVVAPEKIRDLTPADAVAALEAAKAEAYADGQKALKIKPLEWVDFEGQGAKANAFYQANYLITRWRGADEFEVALSYPGYQTGYDGERFHKTLEAAKAAAQADYESRILSALEGKEND